METNTTGTERKNAARTGADAPGIVPDDLYFVEEVDTGAIKIGRCSGKAWKRVSTIQTGNPRDVRLIGDAPGQGWQEAFWHCAWQMQHIRGEWFNDSPELRAAIRSIRVGEDWTAHVPPLVPLANGELVGDALWSDLIRIAFEDYEDEVAGAQASKHAARKIADSFVFEARPWLQPEAAHVS